LNARALSGSSNPPPRGNFDRKQKEGKGPQTEIHSAEVVIKKRQSAIHLKPPSATLVRTWQATPLIKKGAFTVQPPSLRPAIKKVDKRGSPSVNRESAAKKRSKVNGHHQRAFERNT